MIALTNIVHVLAIIEEDWRHFGDHSFYFYTSFIKAAQGLVERATPGEEVLGSIPAVATRSVLVGSVSV